MKNVKITFQIISKGQKPSNGIQFANSHMALDIKMEDFQRMVCLVAGDHFTIETSVFGSELVAMKMRIETSYAIPI